MLDSRRPLDGEENLVTDGSDVLEPMPPEKFVEAMRDLDVRKRATSGAGMEEYLDEPRSSEDQAEQQTPSLIVRVWEKLNPAERAVFTESDANRNKMYIILCQGFRRVQGAVIGKVG